MEKVVLLPLWVEKVSIYLYTEAKLNKYLSHISFLVIYHVVLLLHVSLLVCRDYSG